MLDERQCVICGEYHDEDDMASWACCKDCAEKHATVDIILKYINSRNLFVDFYVEFFTDSSVRTVSATLLELCEREFNSLSEEHQAEELKDYVKTDFSDFCDWLEAHHGEV